MAKAESCFHCVYSRWDRNQAMWMMGVGMPARPMCANQAEFPGRWKECPLGRVCRNYRAKPPTPKGETVKTIPLGDGYYAYVDAADYEWLSRWKWHFQGGYAIRQEKGRVIYMHREIAKPPKGMIVDHKNRNRLDNTRESLRVCTQAENHRNRGKQHGTSSRFKGVTYRKETDKYEAGIHYKGKQSTLGFFDDEIDAARAYDLAAVELFGEFARVNFPEEWPPERRAEVYAQRDAAQKPVGATHASPVQGRGKKAKKRQRKTGRRPGPRATGHKSRAPNKKPRAETQRRGERGRKTKSERAAAERSKGKKEKGKSVGTTHASPVRKGKRKEPRA